MTEELGKEVVQSAPIESTSTPAPVQERTFKQAELNEIVKKVKHEAVEDYRRLHATQPQYAQQKYGEQSNNQQHATEEQNIRRMASEEAQRLRDEWVTDARGKAEADTAQRIVKQFYDKIATGKEKYDDFDKVTGDIELQHFPNVVQLLSEHIDNSGDVLYELGKDRLKMAQLEQLSQMSPRDAIVQAQRMAASIRDNEAAGKQRQANAPLSQQRPSSVGTDSGGVLSMRDLKQKYKG